MARQYRVGAMTHAINGVFRAMTAVGVGASYRRILTVRGRKTGESHSTPVDVMDRGGDLWLVAAYGQVNWVKNARAAGVVTLKRGRHAERFEVHEADPAEAIPVLRQYMVQVPVTRPYFDAAPDASDDRIAAELPRHPVFRLTRAA
jgi:deazaflavin-dependent oxidoreductase (nitroreductase family)